MGRENAPGRTWTNYEKYLQSLTSPSHPDNQRAVERWRIERARLYHGCGVRLALAALTTTAGWIIKENAPALVDPQLGQPSGDLFLLICAGIVFTIGGTLAITGIKRD